MTTFIPNHGDKPAHVHLDQPLVQIGWWGQTGRIYSLDEDPTKTEPGSFAPIWAGWGEGCGHQISEADASSAAQVANLTAAQVNLMSRGVMDQAMTAAEQSFAEIVTAIAVTIDDDERELTKLAMSAGMMAGIDAASAVSRAAGKDVPETAALATWTGQCIARIAAEGV